MFNNQNRYCLCADEQEIFLTRPGGKSGIYQVASGSIEEDKGLVEPLMAVCGRKKGQIALVLPLHDFDVVSVSLPVVAEDAVARMLPYNLAKILPKPVSDYVYDWHVAQKLKDRYEVSVYLYPEKQFTRINRELKLWQKELCWFEPDIFAACSYLEKMNHPAVKESVVILQVWNTSVSICVYEDEHIVLGRCVELVLPSGTPRDEKERKAEKVLREEEKGTAEPEQEDENEVILLDDEEPLEKVDPFAFVESHSMLDGFNLQKEDAGSDLQEEESLTVKQEKGEKVEGGDDGWEDYIEHLLLEISRTMDYHRSVLKGNRVKHLCIGGAERFWSEFQEALGKVQNVQCHCFPDEEIKGDCSSPSIAALSVGGLNR